MAETYVPAGEGRQTAGGKYKIIHTIGAPKNDLIKGSMDNEWRLRSKLTGDFTVDRFFAGNAHLDTQGRTVWTYAIFYTVNPSRNVQVEGGLDPQSIFDFAIKLIGTLFAPVANLSTNIFRLVEDVVKAADKTVKTLANPGVTILIIVGIFVTVGFIYKRGG